MRKKIMKALSRNTYLVIFFVLALFLRFYNLENTAMFLGDQGRDAIIVKRIVTFENLPAIGPPSSIGQVYLGPFYYYLIAPFLLIFKFNPVGLAFAVGFYSLILSFAIYYFSKEILNKNLRLALLLFMLFSPILLEFSRFSWNPNLLPYFSFLTTIFFVKAIKKKSLKDFLIFGGLSGLTIQLHYAFLFILPLYALYLFYYSLKEKWEIKKIVKLSLSSLTLFTFLISPLIIFDLRYNFLNLKNFLKLVEETQPAQFSFANNLTTAISKSLSFAFQAKIFGKLPVLSLFLLLSLVVINFKRIKKEPLFSLSFFKIIILIFAIALFNFRPIPHYFGVLYLPLYLLLTSALLKLFKKPPFFASLLFIFLFWLPQYKNLLSTPETPQIPYARATARNILPLVAKEKEYQLIALPPWESTKHFRYFLEIWGKRPLEEESSKIPEALIIVCFKECKDPIGDPQWQIAAFPNKKIDKIVKFKNLKIVKIIDGKKR